MRLNFTGRNIEVTPALKTFTQEKFQRLERRHDNISAISIVFQVENLTHIAKANLHLEGAEIHATAESDDMYNAIDKLIDKLLGEITKHKEKRTGH